MLPKIPLIPALRRFCGDEDGAVTVDWVVLCAGIVLMAATIMTASHDNTVGFADTLASWMGNQAPS